MKFEVEGSWITLQGDPDLYKSQISLKALFQIGSLTINQHKGNTKMKPEVVELLQYDSFFACLWDYIHINPMNIMLR